MIPSLVIGLLYVVGVIVSLVVLYGIIRLAVTHAIVAARQVPENDTRT